MKKIICSLLVVCVIIAGGVIWHLSKNSGEVRTVTVYVSEDQVFSEPILKDFEKETGIKVKAVYDTEETKSTEIWNICCESLCF